MRLNGKTALVTGGSRGLGSAIVRAIAMEGADVAINYLTQYEAAENVASEVRSLGKRAVVIQADVADFGSVKKMIDQIIREFGHLDILVNNAGFILWRKLANVTKEEWDNIIQVNLTGVFNCTKCVLPGMIGGKSGKIVIISSIFAFHGQSGSVAYSAAKSGLIGFTRTLAKEVGPYGINVNALAPGYILTDLSKNVSEEEKGELVSTIPLRRAGLPKDVANVAAFLASEEASYITGEVIVIDGGWKL